MEYEKATRVLERILTLPEVSEYLQEAYPRLAEEAQKAIRAVRASETLLDEHMEEVPPAPEWGTIRVDDFGSNPRGSDLVEIDVEFVDA